MVGEAMRIDLSMPITSASVPHIEYPSRLPELKYPIERNCLKCQLDDCVGIDNQQCPIAKDHPLGRGKQTQAVYKPYTGLTEKQQARARLLFSPAGPGDGFLYQLIRAGRDISKTRKKK